MSQVVVFLSGLVFAVGLGIAGMTDANKVIGFLDVSGGWDPSLGLVMAAAIAVHWPLYRLSVRRPAPRFAPAFQIPTRRDLTVRLAVGSALFGAGWGLGGYCPGPAIVSAATLNGAALVFLAAMSAGMVMFHAFEAVVAERAKPTPTTDA